MASIKLKFDFSKILEDVKDAGGDVEKAAARCANECAKLYHNELVSECGASGVPSSVSSKIRDKVTETAGGNRYEVEVGWEMGEYNPKNPSAGYKAVFLNYGTPKQRFSKHATRVFYNGRWVTTARRGVITGRGFIQRAKRGATKKVKQRQKEVLQEIMKELK